jgi:hypothetical protein
MLLRRTPVALRGLTFGIAACACGGRANVDLVARDQTPLAAVRRAMPSALAPVGGEHAEPLRHVLPTRSDGALRLETSARDASVEIAPEALADVEGVRDGDAFVYRDAALDTDLVLVADGRRVEELRVLRSPRAAATARWRVRGGGAIAGLRVGDRRDVVEAFDRVGRARFATTPMFAVDARGARRALEASIETSREGDTTLVASLDVRGLAYPIVVDPQWTATSGSLAVGRFAHGAALLPDGKVVVAGGYIAASSDTAVAEIFDPTSGSFTKTGSLLVGDIGDLVPTIGGRFLFGSGSTAQVFDAATQSWTATDATQATHRSNDKRVRLADGRVMSVSGYIDGGPADAGKAAEIYDPKSNAWSRVSPLAHARNGPATSLLASGKVLVAGGDGPDSPPTSAEVWDPSTNTWTEVGPMLHAHNEAVGAVALPAGKVLVIGGNYNTGDIVAEIFDEATGSWIDAPGMVTPRSRIRPLLIGGRALVIGGRTTDGTATSLAEWFDPSTMAWSPASSLTTPREAYSATVLADGKVLVAGGVVGDNHDGLTTAEIFDPQLLATGASCTAGSSCTSGVCAQSICCATSCVGTCQSCAVPGHLGTCTLDPACGSLDAGASDAGGAASSTAPVVTGEFKSCARASDCASGHCVDGVCCETACEEKCHSCALPGSPGVCTPEPIGVDLRHECGGGLQCSGTCGPGGACIGSGAGVQCAASRCVSVTGGVGPALCAAAGASCPTDAVTPFDCSPYVCEPAFGACRASCASSGDCANGFLCDTGSKTCVAPPSAESSSGCAYSEAPRAASGLAAFGALAVLLGTARRRSRRR